MTEFETAPGKRFVVEGLDGTGKSTVVNMLLWQFAKNGYETLQIDEPDSPIDRSGNRLLNVASEVRLLAKDGSYDSNPYADLGMMNVSRFAGYKLVTKEFVANGGIAGQARDSDSSVVFQGHSSGLGMDFVEAECRKFMGDDSYFEPDFKTILRLEDEEERLRRIENRGELEVPDKFESRSADFHQLTREGYDIWAQRKGIDITSIEARQPKDEVAEIVLAKLLGATSLYITRYDWAEYREEHRAA